jgi:glycosyltransferase involved in cell wall biosynthesis
MNTIDVSVVIAMRNEEIYVEEAILSILNQTGVIFDIIVVDDASTDNTYEILTQLAREHSNLQVLKNPNPGKAAAYSLGIELSTGTYACLFAGDDIMPQGSLAARYQMIKNYPNTSSIVGLCKLISMSKDKRFDGHLIPKKPGIGGFTGSSYLMNRIAIQKVFPVPSILPNEDSWLELSFSLLPNINVIHSEIVGCQWRVHEGNSINMAVDFDTYNSKITPRMNVSRIFNDKFGSELSEASRKKLLGIIQCENSRLKGDFIGILFSRAHIVDKLRAISIYNRLFYNLRRNFFNFFSGW